MLPRSRRRVAALALAMVAIPIGARGADCLCGTAADQTAAAGVGMRLEWLLQVPFDTTTTAVEHVVIDADLIVVQTGAGNVVAIQAGEPDAGRPLPGTVLWSHPIDEGSGPFQAAAIGEKLVAVAHGDGIHAFARSTGQSLWNSRFPHLADAGAAVSGNWVYTPFSAGKIMRLPVNPYRQPTEADDANAAATGGDKSGQPAKPARKKGRTGPRRVEPLDPVVLSAGGPVSLQPRAFQGGAMWCTDDGTIVVLDRSGDGWRRNDFELGRPAVGRPLVHDGAIFAATVEGDLVRIDSRDDAAGALRIGWSVLLDAEPQPTLFAAGDRLVVPLGDDGIAAYSTQDGTPLWRSGVRGRVVAIAAGRVWLVDRVGRLVSLDLETASPRDRLCLGGFTYPVENQATDRLILVSPTGVVASLTAAPDVTPRR